jgi:hypothetical protein
MAIGIVTNESSVALTIETVEGDYNGNTATSTDYLEVLEEGTEVNKTREELSRNTLSGTVENEAARVGISDVTAALPVEFGASGTEGQEPQRLDKPLRSVLGGKRQEASQATTTGNTATVLEFGAAPNFAKGSIVLVKQAGAFELRPVKTVNATSIELEFALENGAPSDGVVVAAVTTYYHDTTNAPSLSLEHNIGGEIQQRAAGLKGQGMSLENWTAGQIPTASFSFQGTSLERADAAPTASADFTSDALPPVALEACLYINGTKNSYSELGMSIENELTPLIDACQPQGKIGSPRITSQSVSFNAKRYMSDNDLSEWDNFNANTDASVFFFAFNPTTVAGEFENVVAVWLPQCKVIATPVGDQDGIATDDIQMKAHKELGSDSVFISFI